MDETLKKILSDIFKEKEDLEEQDESKKDIAFKSIRDAFKKKK